MAKNVTARKNGTWTAISMAPDVCKTPMGSGTPPIPYPVIAKLGDSQSTVPSVKSNGDPLMVFDQSKIPQTLGDMAGVAKGIKSSTVGADSFPKEHSDSVRAGSKYILRHDDEFWMNGTYNGSGKAKRWQDRKAQIAAAKAKLNDMPPGAERDKLSAATERFEANNTNVEKARLSADVYNPQKGPPEGWNNISGDSEKLGKYGLKPKDLEQPGSEFRAQVYEPDPKVFGNDMKPTVVFKGTTPSSTEDWANNLKQGLNMESSYYKNAVGIGKSVSESGQQVEMAGHSLGGGMASAASRASGRPATTFNAAGLNPKTVERYGGTVHNPASENITVYQVAGEMLTGIQEQGLLGTLGAAAAGFAIGGPVGAAIGAAAKIGLAAGMADALGIRRPLPGTGMNPVGRHGMDQVIDGIESQKKEDQATISSATGVGSE